MFQESKNCKQSAACPVKEYKSVKQTLSARQFCWTFPSLENRPAKNTQMYQQSKEDDGEIPATSSFSSVH